jgi:hypothetical protein
MTTKDEVTEEASQYRSVDDWVEEQKKKVNEYLAQAELYRRNADRAEAAAISLKEALLSMMNGVAHGNNNSSESTS